VEAGGARSATAAYRQAKRFRGGGLAIDEQRIAKLRPLLLSSEVNALNNLAKFGALLLQPFVQGTSERRGSYNTAADTAGDLGLVKDEANGSALIFSGRPSGALTEAELSRLDAVDKKNSRGQFEAKRNVLADNPPCLYWVVAREKLQERVDDLHLGVNAWTRLSS
jgi:hypothetical protein